MHIRVHTNYVVAEDVACSHTNRKGPVNEWAFIVVQATELTSLSSEVETAKLRDAFNRWACGNGFPEVESAQFGKTLKRLRPKVEKGRRGTQSAQTSVYSGLSLVPSDAGSKGSKAFQLPRKVWRR